ncbi:MAG: phosphorylase family protein [Planctomycetota bacterium]
MTGPLAPGILLVTAVDAEARAIVPHDGVRTVVAGIGRTNAAAATTEAILRDGPFGAVLSVGVAGALPDGGLAIGDVVVASRCVYAEEGLLGPEGFVTLAGIGLALGDFPGGPIATVATCSGTDEAAAEVVRRTGAVAEAMEGAAVVHAARRLATPAIELRVISNTTGDRRRQQWDLRGALDALGPAVARAVPALRGPGASGS